MVTNHDAPEPTEDEYSSSSCQSASARNVAKVKKRRHRTRRSRPTDAKESKSKAKPSDATSTPKDVKDNKDGKLSMANQQPTSANADLGPVPQIMKSGPGVAMLLAEIRQSRGAELLQSTCPPPQGCSDLPSGADAQAQIAQYAAELQRVSSELATAQQMLRSNQSEAAVIRTTLESQQSVIQSYQAAEAAEKALRERNAKLEAEEAKRIAAMEADDNRPRRKLSRSRSPHNGARSSSSSTTTARSSRSFDIDCSPAPMGTARLLEKPPPPVPRRATHVDDQGNFLVPINLDGSGRGRRRNWNNNRGGNKGRGKGYAGWW